MHKRPHLNSRSPGRTCGFSGCAGADLFHDRTSAHPVRAKHIRPSFERSDTRELSDLLVDLEIELRPRDLSKSVAVGRSKQLQLVPLTTIPRHSGSVASKLPDAAGGGWTADPPGNDSFEDALADRE